MSQESKGGMTMSKIKGILTALVLVSAGMYFFSDKKQNKEEFK